MGCALKESTRRLAQKIPARRRRSPATCHPFALEAAQWCPASFLYIAPPTIKAHALPVLSQGQTHPHHAAAASSSPSILSSVLAGVRPHESERMGSLASEKTVVGWAARDATGHLSPYSYTLRYVRAAAAGHAWPWFPPFPAPWIFFSKHAC